MLEAARRRAQPADHLLFAGPPGLGKTSLAGIVANEMGAGLRITSGPALVRAGDLAAILTNLAEGDVLFVDEIHRLGRAVEEILYPAMEDFQLDIVLGKGPSARTHPPRPAPLHPGGRHHPHRAHHRPAAGPVRLRGPAGLLQRRRPRRHHPPVGGHPRGPPRRRRGGGDRPAGPGHAPHRQPPPQAGPGLRRGARRRLGRRAGGPPGPGAVRRRRARPGQGGPGHPGRRLLPLRGRPGRPVDPGRQRRGGDRHRRGRLRAVPAASSGCSCGRPGAGWRPRRPGCTSASTRRRTAWRPDSSTELAATATVADPRQAPRDPGPAASGASPRRPIVSRHGGARLRPAREPPSPSDRSSRGTPPGCWTPPTRPGRIAHRTVRDLPLLLGPATCWWSTPPG